MRTPGKKRRQRTAPPTLSARQSAQVTLETHPDGDIFACFDGFSDRLGKFSAGAGRRAQELRTGLPLGSSSSSRSVEKEIDLLVRRLARRGLLEYRLTRGDQDQVVIEPQMADYWPRMPRLGDAETLVLSRFAYLRRRGNEMVLESPRAGALFRICDPDIATVIAALSTPQKISRLRRRKDFPGVELLALLVDCRMLFKLEAAGNANLRAAEGDDNLVLWDFHDLLFHTRSTEGRQANPLGGVYPHGGAISPLAAVRPRWPGRKIDLRKFSAAPTNSPVATLLRERHSTRDFDDLKPITLEELSRFLESTARVQSRWKTASDLDDGGPDIEYTARPYPSAGSVYELELYLAVTNCEGLARGFYHYDAGEHALMPIDAPAHQFEALLTRAELAMDAPAPPQILITIAARFGRVSWKYSSVAYSLILKDVGVLIQTFYLMATEMGLGGCAIGTNNIELFEKMTGSEFHVEGAVGQFALGRGAEPRPSG